MHRVMDASWRGGGDPLHAGGVFGVGLPRLLSTLFMSTFLTIKDASDKTGKSVSTIRRLVRDIVIDDAHKDRAGIHPTPAEVKKLQAQEVQFAWKLSEELLQKHFGSFEALQAMKKDRQSEGVEEVLSVLRDELQSKDRQLAAKDSQIEKLGSIIGSLNDRLREGNVLMATLQKQLQLPEQTKTTVDTELKVKKAKEAKQKAVAKVLPQQPASKPGVGKKRGWLAALFG